MNYVVKNKLGNWEELRLFYLKKFDNGIYYRTAVLETDDQVRFNLVDIPLGKSKFRVKLSVTQ